MSIQILDAVYSASVGYLSSLESEILRISDQMSEGSPSDDITTEIAATEDLLAQAQAAQSERQNQLDTEIGGAWADYNEKVEAYNNYMDEGGKAKEGAAYDAFIAAFGKDATTDSALNELNKPCDICKGTGVKGTDDIWIQDATKTESFYAEDKTWAFYESQIKSHEIQISSLNVQEDAASATADNMTLNQLTLQKLVGEWSLALSTATALMKSMSDGFSGVARNF